MSQFDGEKYDYVISGTSLYKSILSAALSRAGQKVLHVDKNSYYGSENEASFDLETFTSLNETIKGIKYDEFAGDKSKNKKFTLDLCPRLLYANGSMVKLLVKSKICRYLEFRNVDGFFIEDGSKLISVPCSKSALFTTTTLSPMEKRKMMKFISENSESSESSNSTNSNETFSPKDQPETKFGDYLKTLDLTPKLEKYISSCLAFSSKDDTLATVKHRIDLFLSSYGKYGQSAFLFPLYGNAELHQAFSRLSAVFGAIFCLNYEDPENLKSTVTAKEFIFEDEYVKEKNLAKACVISTEKLFDVDNCKDKNDTIDLIILNDNITVFEIGGLGGQIGPKDAIVYYFSSRSLDKLKEKVESLIKTHEQNLVCATFLKEHVECVFDYESEVASAKKKFHELLGDNVEFLEAAPEPEDIIRDGE